MTKCLFIIALCMCLSDVTDTVKTLKPPLIWISSAFSFICYIEQIVSLESITLRSARILFMQIEDI